MLEVVLSNQNEPAFLAMVKITLPKNVFLTSALRECNSYKSSDDEESQEVRVLVCEFANPLNHLESVGLTTVVLT